MIRRFVEWLQSAGVQPTPTEVADALWLARLMTPNRSNGAEVVSEEPVPAGAAQDPFELRATERREEEVERRAKGAVETWTANEIRTVSTRARRGLSTRVSHSTALPDQPAFGRAFRLLRRRVRGCGAGEIDEDETVERVASERIWRVVTRPGPSPWLDLAFVVDQSTSMDFWWKTVVELRALLERTGVFRQITVHSLNTECRQISFTTGTTVGRHQRRSVGGLINSTGTTLVLLVTDGIAAGWWTGTVAQWLKEVGYRAPTALLYVLPETLWLGAAFASTRTEKAHGCTAGSTSEALILSHRHSRRRVGEVTVAKVPLIPLDPESVGAWAQMLTKPLTLAKVALLPLAGEMPREEAVQTPLSEPSHQIFLRRFEATASPKARRLARLLSAAPVTLPIMRLVRETMLPEAHVGHVAEVFLSGLLERLDDAHTRLPEDVRYDFKPGIREALLSQLPRRDAVETLVRVSRLVQRRLGKPVDFLSLLAGNEEDLESWRAEEVREFASVAVDVLRSQGSQYSELSRRLVGEKSVTSGVSGPGGISAGADQKGKENTRPLDTLAVMPGGVFLLKQYHGVHTETIVGKLLEQAGTSGGIKQHWLLYSTYRWPSSDHPTILMRFVYQGEPPSPDDFLTEAPRNATYLIAIPVPGAHRGLAAAGCASGPFMPGVYLIRQEGVTVGKVLTSVGTRPGVSYEHWVYFRSFRSPGPDFPDQTVEYVYEGLPVSRDEFLGDLPAGSVDIEVEVQQQAI